MTLHATPFRLITFFILAGVLLALWFLSPATDPAGHLHFVNGTDLPGIPNTANVLSNLPFLFVGAWGLWVVLGGGKFTAQAGSSLSAATFSVGLILTAFGSSLFHLQPSDESLFWDRIPMVVTFMSLLSFVVTDRISPRSGWKLLVALVGAGLGSLLEWRYGSGDLRPYILVQYGGLAVLLALALTFPTGRLPNRAIYAALGFYALAKVFEVQDAAFYDLTNGVLSGHSAKHLAAAGGAAVLVRGLKLIFGKGNGYERE